jgi:hypothetical protein
MQGGLLYDVCDSATDAWSTPTQENRQKVFGYAVFATVYSHLAPRGG